MLTVINDGDKVLFQKTWRNTIAETISWWNLRHAIFSGQTTFIVFKKKQIAFIRIKCEMWRAM